MTESSEIEVRKLTFDVERGAGGLWNPRRPELSHTLNAFQLALPYLEPYFIDAVREGAELVIAPKLKADAHAFCAQEANHSRQHKRYCRLLQQRYPRLKEYETAIQQSLIRSRKEDPLPWRLAYTAGYEAITAQLARWLFKSADEWFAGADEHFAALMTWHAAEEIEHRHVAFDVFQAVDRSYPLRVKGLLAAMKKTYADMTPVVTYMLEVDGYAERLDSRARRLRLRMGLVSELLPAAARYLTPAYNPAKDAEPRGFAEWLRAHEGRIAPSAPSEPIASAEG
jgi:predicted metal-dependent hydrolase